MVFVECPKMLWEWCLCQHTVSEVLFHLAVWYVLWQSAILVVAINRLFYGRAFHYSITAPKAEAIDEVREMVEQGEIRPLIDAVYTLNEIVAAHKHVESGHTQGNVIVTMV